MVLNEYGNTDTPDLWDVLDLFAEEFIPENLYLDQIMDTWTKQEGYPVVTSDGSTISQERFFLNATGKNFHTSRLHCTEVENDRFFSGQSRQLGFNVS